ncbi:dolichyl-diphosphooligosaccharide--protein glycosyltransferase subunit 4A isoform X1 [Nicotiana tomentosiformis]|nr:dolichyl-diphosphooligosaccharide--protein glycosyltransferase subunit 4A isoform X1 [Nicotiana tomentosiformis]
MQYDMSRLCCCLMMDDQDLGFFANFLGIFIFVLVIAYHYVMADPKYEGN